MLFSFLLFGPRTLTYFYPPWARMGEGHSPPHSNPIRASASISAQLRSLYNLNQRVTWFLVLQAPRPIHTYFLMASQGAPEACSQSPLLDNTSHQAPLCTLQRGTCPPQSGPAHAATLDLVPTAHSQQGYCTHPSPGTPLHEVPHLKVSAQAVP